VEDPAEWGEGVKKTNIRVPEGSEGESCPILRIQMFMHNMLRVVSK